MKMKYYDPNFYICSDEMPFTVKLRCILKDAVDGAVLYDAAQTAIRRYPYYAIRVVRSGEEYLTEPNPLPIAVYEGKKVFPLGGKEVNGHMIALSYSGRELYFQFSHVIGDGAGFFPFVKTTLYYYFCKRYHTQLDSTDIRLADTPFYPDELCNPYPEEKMKQQEEPFYTTDKGDYFEITDGVYAGGEPTVYYCKVKQKDFMRFNRMNDGSPCSLGASLATRAIWKLHPETEKNIVCDVSFNMRFGLGNRTNYRMLCRSIPLIYGNKLRDKQIIDLGTYSRGMTMLHTQPENVLYYCERRRKALRSIENIKTLAERKKIWGEKALKDANANTFSISYVGQMGLGSLEPYIEAIYNLTDGSTYKRFFIEISSVGEWFDIAFLQGFSSDVYYRGFLEQLKENEITYIDEGSEPMALPKVCLP